MISNNRRALDVWMPLTPLACSSRGAGPLLVIWSPSEAATVNTDTLPALCLPCALPALRSACPALCPFTPLPPSASLPTRLPACNISTTPNQTSTSSSSSSSQLLGPLPLPLSASAPSHGLLLQRLLRHLARRPLSLLSRAARRVEEHRLRGCHAAGRREQTAGRHSSLADRAPAPHPRYRERDSGRSGTHPIHGAAQRQAPAHPSPLCAGQQGPRRLSPRP